MWQIESRIFLKTVVLWLLCGQSPVPTDGVALGSTRSVAYSLGGDNHQAGFAGEEVGHIGSDSESLAQAEESEEEANPPVVVPAQPGPYIYGDNHGNVFGPIYGDVHIHGGGTLYPATVPPLSATPNEEEAPSAFSGAASAPAPSSQVFSVPGAPPDGLWPSLPASEWSQSVASPSSSSAFSNAPSQSGGAFSQPAAAPAPMPMAAPMPLAVSQAMPPLPAPTSVVPPPPPPAASESSGLRTEAISLNLKNLNYDALVADVALRDSLKRAVRLEIAKEAGLEPQHVTLQLSQGSVNVDATVEIPSGSSDSEVQAGLSDPSLADSVAGAVSSIEGIEQAATGEISASVTKGPGSSAPSVSAAPPMDTVTVPAVCSLSCIEGQGLCHDGICKCRTPYTGLQCEKKMEVGFRLPLWAAIGAGSIAIPAGASLSVLLWNLYQAAGVKFEYTSDEDFQQKPEVWSPGLN